MPGGHPAAPHFIVPQNEILDDPATLDEVHNITTLALALPDIIQWCARRRLLKNSCICPRCNLQCGLISRHDVSDGKTWNCSACKVHCSIRQDSWFARSYLSLHIILILGYCWAYDYPQKAMARERLHVMELIQWLTGAIFIVSCASSIWKKIQCKLVDMMR